MIFNSSTFLVFFILFFFLYWWINNKFGVRARNVFTIVASYIFYGWWDWRFLGLIIISSLGDYIIGLCLHKPSTIKTKRLLLLFSLLINLGLLGFFKYFNFFVDSFSQFFALFDIHLNPSTLNIILPVGISFYTFQTLSYTIDIYRKKIEPTRDIISFFAFVSFFPQLVAGPIERASNLLHQFHKKKSFDYPGQIAGLRLVLWGFFKKIVIADNFGMLADNIFAAEASLSGLTVFFGTLFFAVQIYADFSGYSDIAIGISRMLGFRLMTNFSTPYFAASFRKFWQRWHISLSSWFRDYVYFPLGGSKKGAYRTYINLFITFVLSGLWHGASITFILWGALHAIMLIIEKLFRPDRFRQLYYPFVLITVILLWLPFRASSLDQLQAFGLSLIQVNEYSFSQLHQYINDFSLIRFLALAGIFLFFMKMEYSMQLKDFNVWIAEKSKWVRWLIYYILLLSILFAGNFSVKPSFIYFQF